jgi:hypothetical protein
MVEQIVFHVNVLLKNLNAVEQELPILPEHRFIPGLCGLSVAGTAYSSGT